MYACRHLCMHVCNYACHVRMSVHMYDCLPISSMTVLSRKHFTLGGSVAEDPRERSVQYEVVWREAVLKKAASKQASTPAAIPQAKQSAPSRQARF